MGLGSIIAIVSGIIASLALLFAGIKWVLNTVKDSSFDSGKHDSTHERIEIQIEAAHNKIRKHADEMADMKEDISDVESNVSLVVGKLDTIMANQQTIIGALVDKG